MFETVVIATDGSESVKRAVDVSLDLAGRFDADVHALSVVDASEVDASPEQLREELETALDEARHRDRTTVIVVEVDGERGIPGYEAWWDVPIAEVAEMEPVQRARAAYEQARSSERHFL